jgi:hypothetical protein
MEEIWRVFIGDTSGVHPWSDMICLFWGLGAIMLILLTDVTCCKITPKNDMLSEKSVKFVQIAYILIGRPSDEKSYKIDRA